MSAVLSQCTSVIIPGDNQLNYKGLISIKEGMGLMKPIENPLGDNSASLIDPLLTSSSGG
jgi:hypothetical protein